MDLDFIGACMKGDIEMVNDLLKAGANPNQDNRYGETPLYWASCYGYLGIAELLLKAGADPNQTDDNGNTPLYWAVYGDNFEIAELLLKAGANHNQANNDGETPLHWAENNGRLETVKLLKSYKNKISSLSLLCLRTIYRNQINTDNVPSMILEWSFHQ